MKSIQPLNDHLRDITVPCGRDKSLTHRAVMFSSLADGISVINNPLLGADCRSTMECFQKLGVKIDIQDEKVRIESTGSKSFQSPDEDLDCGNSGTTARLFVGLFSGIEGLKVTLVGDESLSKRPMDRVVNPLRLAGGRFVGKEEGKYLPLTIEGSEIKAHSYEIDKATAQVKSALLLASLASQGQTTIRLPAGSRDHTENMLRSQGASCETKIADGFETVVLQSPFTITPREYNIPVDPSSAAFFAVYGLLRKGGKTAIPQVLDNPTRTGFIDILKRMSPKISYQKNPNSHLFVEPIIDINVEGSLPLQGTEISPEEVPTLVDEIPILAVAAAFASSPSRFRGLAELRVKESDRLAKTHEMLRLAGADCRIVGEDLIILGGLKQVNCFQFDSEGDHRLAMSAAILAKFGSSPSKIEQAECVDVSFPNFYEELDKFES